MVNADASVMITQFLFHNKTLQVFNMCYLIEFDMKFRRKLSKV